MSKYIYLPNLRHPEVRSKFVEWLKIVAGSILLIATIWIFWMLAYLLG